MHPHLFRLGLKPNEFMGLSWLIMHVGQGLRLTTGEFALALGWSQGTAHNVLHSLIGRGLISRSTGSIISVHLPEDSVHLAEDSIQNSEHSYIDTISTSEEDPKEASIGAFKKLNIPMADFGRLDMSGETPKESPAPKARKTTKGAVPQFHRGVPRQDWDMRYVVKEWQTQMRLKRPDIIGGGAGKNLPVILNKWAKDYDITVQDFAYLMDTFFADEKRVASLRNNPPAINFFLQFVKAEIDTAKQRGEIMDEESAVQNVRAQFEGLL